MIRRIRLNYGYRLHRQQTDFLSLIHISGDKNQQRRLRTLRNESNDIFSNELPAAPAKIPEFHLTVKDDEWRVARNRAPN